MRLLSTLRPTQNQMIVLAKIVASQDVPARAAAEISTNTNMIAARNLLMKLNAITYTDNSASLTDIGQQLAREQNIVDESGQLTEEGNKLAASTADGKQPKEAPPAQDNSMSGMPPPDMGNDLNPPMPGMESFSPLFKNILNG